MKTMKFICLAVLFPLFVVGCSKSDSVTPVQNSSKPEPAAPIESGSKSGPVRQVQNGTLDFDKSVTVGNALGGYTFFGQGQWRSFETSQKRIVVEFKAPLDLDKFVGAEIKELGLKATAANVQKVKDLKLKFVYKAQFKISADGKTFALGYSSIQFSGTNRETGKLVEQDIPDEKFGELKRIYQNQAPLSVVGLMLN